MRGDGVPGRARARSYGTSARAERERRPAWRRRRRRGARRSPGARREQCSDDGLRSSWPSPARPRNARARPVKLARAAGRGRRDAMRTGRAAGCRIAGADLAQGRERSIESGWAASCRTPAAAWPRSTARDPPDRHREQRLRVGRAPSAPRRVSSTAPPEGGRRARQLGRTRRVPGAAAPRCSRAASRELRDERRRWTSLMRRPELRGPRRGARAAADGTARDDAR